MRHRYLFALLFLSLLLLTFMPITQAQTGLVAGDIAIIGANFDNPDEFAFVLLTNIDAGTVINFTDNGWFSSGSFRTGEGTLTWTAPTSYCAGSVITPGVGGMAFATDGDQILAYQGAAATPTFVYAMNNEGAGVWQTDATSSNTSALPSGLTNTVTAVALNEIDNAVYAGITSGTRANLLAAIGNNSNWTGSDSTRQTMPTGPFTVTDAPPCGGDAAPSVSSTIPSNNAAGVAVNANLSITFNEAVNVAEEWFQIACPISGTRLVGDTAVTGGPITFTINPNVDFAENETCTITIYAAQVTDQDSDDPPDNMTADYIFNFTTVNPSGITKIHQVQGSGSIIAITGMVTIEGVVVGDYQANNQLRGFFLQEETADQDTNPATSEGIFVYCNACATAVAEGQIVQATGNATDFFGMSQVDVTASGGSVTVINAGDNMGLVTPASLDLPVPASFTNIDDYYEQFEGMLVTFADELTVTEYFQLARYGQIILAEGGKLDQFTQINLPDATGYTNHLDDVARRRVILDDLNNTQNVTDPVHHPQPGGFSLTNYVRGGYTVSNLRGVLHYSWAGKAAPTPSAFGRRSPTPSPSPPPIRARRLPCRPVNCASPASTSSTTLTAMG
jgi:hypothetical protein